MEVREIVRRRTYTDAEKQTCVRLYLDDRLTVPEIAERTGFPVWSIVKWVTGQKRNKHPPKQHNGPSREDYLDKYFASFDATYLPLALTAATLLPTVRKFPVDTQVDDGEDL